MRYRRSTVAGASYFFTVVTYRRQRLLVGEAVAILEQARQTVQGRRPFTLEAQVVLPDHVHALWTLPDEDCDFPTRWRLIKEAFTRAYAKDHRLQEPDPARRARGERTVWQRRYWEHLVRDDRDFCAHVEYIHYNPVRHRLVKAPADWPHSTFLDWVARGNYERTWGSGEMPKLPSIGRE